MRLHALFAATAAVLLAAGPAVAGTAAGSFNVTANVAASCKVTSTSDINFGAYDPADVNNTTPLDGAGSVTVRCVKGTSATVTLDQGANADGGSTPAAPLRRMANGGEFLSYGVYQDAGRSVVWGDTAATGQAFTAVGVTPGNETTLTTYGRLPAGQDVGIGSFSDTVNVTVTF